MRGIYISVLWALRHWRNAQRWNYPPRHYSSWCPQSQYAGMLSLIILFFGLTLFLGPFRLCSSFNSDVLVTVVRTTIYAWFPFLIIWYFIPLLFMPKFFPCTVKTKFMLLCLWEADLWTCLCCFLSTLCISMLEGLMKQVV